MLFAVMTNASSDIRIMLDVGLLKMPHNCQLQSPFINCQVCFYVADVSVFQNIVINTNCMNIESMHAQGNYKL